MLQRFASALFGGDPEELKGSRAEGGRKEEEEEQDEEWILVECLGEFPQLLPLSVTDQYQQPIHTVTVAREEVQASFPIKRSLPVRQTQPEANFC